MKSHFSVNDKGHLMIGGASAVELAEKFGTPLYVEDEQRIRENYRRFRDAWTKRWDKVKICYAYKANSNSAVIKVLASEGCGAELSSLCELKMAIANGVKGEDMTSNGNFKPDELLELAIETGVLINLDSMQEIEIVNDIAGKVGNKARVGIRINPDVKAPLHPYVSTGLRENKFGLDVASGRAIEGYKLASEKENLNVLGVHYHIGSGILDPEPFVEAAGKIIEVLAKIKDETGVEVKYMDIGGGLGVPYDPNEKELSPDIFAEKITSVAKEGFEKHGLTKPTLIMEPGRFIKADTAVLLGRVGYTKERHGTPDWVSIDAGMNAIIRPALYGAYHHIEVANKMNAKPTHEYNIAGPLCESGDFLGKNRMMPEVERGDLMVVYDVGAYGLAMSNQHTAQHRPAVVMVNNGKAEIVREREKCEDLTRLDRIPTWLK